MTDQALFEENYIAARSQRSLWTKGASTSGCVYIQITQRNVIVKCHWFLGWLINGMGLDLNHVIPRSRITVASKSGKPHLIYKDTVLIEFRDKAGKAQNLELYMNRAGDFLRALGYSG